MIDWLVGTIGFTVISRIDGADGQLVHAELGYGNSAIMIGHAADDDYGAIVGPPGAAGGKALYIAVDDVDGLFARVAATGATIEEGLTDRPYGSREFICRDAEGNVWCFGTYRPQPG